MQIELKEISAFGESVEPRQVIAAEDAHRQVVTQADVAEQPHPARLEAHEPHEAKVRRRVGVEDRPLPSVWLRALLGEKRRRRQEEVAVLLGQA